MGGFKLASLFWAAQLCEQAFGYKREESERVQVHFVPHSHMDAGWLHTYDQYYDERVRRIFDSVFAQLHKDPIFTYTLGDIAFFRRYYLAQSKQNKEAIKALVAQGQLELVQGGYVSPDEATTNYTDVLRNYEAGHDFLRQEFGVTPRIGWQLDPFGHSAVTAFLLAEMGMQAVFFARINKQKFEELQDASDLEFIWAPHFAKENEQAGEIFAHVLHDHYNPPYFISNGAYMAGMSYSKNHAASQAPQWLRYFEEYLESYKTRNILILWGDDFAHSRADRTYEALSNTIEAIDNLLTDAHAGTQYSLKFSTVGEYLSEVWLDAQKKDEIIWKKEIGDFWAYNHEPYSDFAYWTAYFSTNADFKGSATDFCDLTHATELITSLSAPSSQTASADQASLEEIASIMQHHDAMTGTHPHETGEDYLKMIKTERDKIFPPIEQDATSPLLSQLVKIARARGLVIESEGSIALCEVKDSLRVDCSDFAETEEAQQVLILYNSNAASQNGLLLQGLPVTNSYRAELFDVSGSSGRIEVFSETLCSDAKEGASQQCELFLDAELPAISTSFILLQKQNIDESNRFTAKTIFRSELGKKIAESESGSNTGSEKIDFSSTFSVGLDDGQTLSLRPLTDSDSPLVLSCTSQAEDVPQVMSFSVHFVQDPVHAKQNSGYYGMTVEQMTGETKKLAFPTEVRVQAGKRVAQIQVSYFFDNEGAYETCKSLSNDCFEQKAQLINAKKGSVVFTVVTGRNEVLQSLSVPRLSATEQKSREIFGVWAPFFDGTSFSKQQISEKFLTDAQGYALMTRTVYNDEDDTEFAEHFYPVDSLISVADAAGRRSFTVWNDRPQAGSVHSNQKSGGIKLLIDRRVRTNDKGGIRQPMYQIFGANLELSFRFAMREQQIDQGSMLRKHKILAMHSENFVSSENSAEAETTSHAALEQKLRTLLEAGSVIQVSIKKLSSARIRVRLDLAKSAYSLGPIDFSRVLSVMEERGQLAEIVQTYCQLFNWNSDVDFGVCPSSAQVRLSGLFGIKPSVNRKFFSELEELPVDQKRSRFVTFELDLSGQLSNFDDWTDGQVERKFQCHAGDEDCEEGSVQEISFTDIMLSFFKAE